MSDQVANPPQLARRREHRKSTVRLGRTIGEAREKLETSNERALARKKDKRKKIVRFVIATIVFVAVITASICLIISLISQSKEQVEIGPEPDTSDINYQPSIQIIDEASAVSGGKITNRMQEYIGQLETDLKELGYQPTKAVIRAHSIREVDIYLDGYTGYLKAIIDRGAGVTAEDIDRMLRYLSEQGITEFEYIDVRIDGKAYWK